MGTGRVRGAGSKKRLQPRGDGRRRRRVQFGRCEWLHQCARPRVGSSRREVERRRERSEKNWLQIECSGQCEGEGATGALCRLIIAAIIRRPARLYGSAHLVGLSIFISLPHFCLPLPLYSSAAYGRLEPKNASSLLHLFLSHLATIVIVIIVIIISTGESNFPWLPLQILGETANRVQEEQIAPALTLPSLDRRLSSSALHLWVQQRLGQCVSPKSAPKPPEHERERERERERASIAAVCKHLRDARLNPAVGLLSRLG